MVLRLMRIVFMLPAMFSTCFMLKGADINDVIEALKSTGNYKGEVNVEVTLPMAAEDQVGYKVKLVSREAEGDTLSSIDYLIDWELPTKMGLSKGFSCYFDGNFYRYRDGSKLQEYHAEDNIEPFVWQSAVQKTAQFLDMFPWSIGEDMSKMSIDSTYMMWLSPDTVFQGESAAVLKVKRTLRGETAAEITYVLDKNTFAPKYIEKEMSPGSIGQQTIVYRYSNGGDTDIEMPKDEEGLSEIYADVFSNFREGSYGLNSLKGKQLPSFSLPDLTGSRYSRTRGEALKSPTLIVFLDESVSTTGDLLSDARKALNSMPFNVDVVWVFLSNRIDEIAELTGAVSIGETVLSSGRNVVKDFGVTETPSLVFVNLDGTVNDVMTGYKQDMGSTISQKLAILK